MCRGRRRPCCIRTSSRPSRSWGTAETDIVDVSGAYSIVPALHFGWETLNLRLGLGYGNWSIPGLNFVVPARTVIPEFDFYALW